MPTKSFTQGPWVIEGNDLFGKEDGYTVHVAEIHMNDDDNQFSRENAHLIATAPELYEMLAQTAEYFSDADGLEEDEYIYRQEVRAALAKARGEIV